MRSCGGDGRGVEGVDELMAEFVLDPGVGAIEITGQWKHGDPHQLGRTAVLRTDVERREADPLNRISHRVMKTVLEKRGYVDHIDRVENIGKQLEESGGDRRLVGNDIR